MSVPTILLYHNSISLDKLRNAYRQALKHARFRLTIERTGRPITFNHYFNANLQKKRSERMSESLMAFSFGGEEQYVPIAKVDQYSASKHNGQQVCEDILDTLMGYYKVSRKWFVDIVCQQVISHFLLRVVKTRLRSSVLT
jgi:hypothetical protein